jgi:hypothetical protein
MANVAEISAETLLQEYVLRHNEGVRTGDFSRMLELFAQEARMRFAGFDAGPFEGRGAIAEAFRTKPPDDELSTFEVKGGMNCVRAEYAWSRKPGTRSGEISLECASGRIVEIEVKTEG